MIRLKGIMPGRRSTFRRIAMSPLLGLWIVLTFGCSDDSIGPAIPETLFFNPMVSDPAVSVAASAGATAAPALDVVYVSLSPGSLTSGTEVEVRNLASDVEARIPIAGGGFDPVPIPANAGDTLRFRAFDGFGDSEHERPIIAQWWERVPARSPPDIVRTYPPKGRRDLPVALSVLIVFSEPIDSASAAASIQLSLGGSPVPGEIAFTADWLTATLRPSAPLSPNVEYVLSVGTGVRDLDGDAIDGAEEVRFSTGDPGSQPVLAPTELCSNYSPTSIATFVDANLEGAIHTALGWPVGDPLTCELVASLTSLTYSPASYQQLPPPPTVVTSLVGIQNLTGLTRLVLPNHGLTDMSPLAGLTSLDTLTLSSGNGTPPTISDLGPLRGLTGLKYLNLSNTVGVRDLSPLNELTSLSQLHIRFNSIMDLGPLRGLTSLTRLNLAGNAIVDLTPLSGLTNLTWLAVNENQIIDVAPLAGLTKIGDKLWLYGNRITDLSPIGGLTGVTWLIAHDNQITNLSGMDRLTNLTNVVLDFNANLTDIQPLLDNPGLGAGDEVTLRNTSVSCDDVALLQAKSVRVAHACSIPPVPVVKITTTSFAGANVGVSYAQVLMATGGNGVYTWQLSTGALPQGLALSASGVISGVPTAVETAWFRLNVRDNPLTSGQLRPFSITVSGP